MNKFIHRVWYENWFVKEEDVILLHALMLAPLAPLWRVGFPRHPLRRIIPAGLPLAIGLEGVQYLLPYRAWNVNDAIGNGAGVLLSPLLPGMRRPARF